ncbi:hypothetical protein ACLIBG_00470 [Virgibacillus sp. W0181]|uniref:hypothetical protein n=1 Tax=Virgibacillus sp. W0181 TaxID=3391581 RepID=UPI003F479785
MDNRIKGLIDFTYRKFGLNNYYLQRYHLDRSVNIFNKTIYTLCMEWFPNHLKELEDDDLNPEGTAVIEINIHSRKFERVIFVGGTSYADGLIFPDMNIETIVKWIEQETGLSYGEEFQLHKAEKGEFHFKQHFAGVAISPSGSIEVKVDLEGKLTFFAVHGEFLFSDKIKNERYTLSLEKIENFAKEQLGLVEFPLFEQEKLMPVYAVEEVYITNDQTSMIPFEFIVDERSRTKIDQTLYWEAPIHQTFERQEIQMTEDVTIEQAFSGESSPDSFPITKTEHQKCVEAVSTFLRKEYPNDTGKWILKTLHRDKEYIHATLRVNKQDDRVFQRKINVMIGAKSFQPLNYIDNQPMLEMIEEFQAPEQVTITKEAAYEKLKKLFKLDPYYVYDFEQKQYVLCGRLDCLYGVDASTGEIVALDDIS